MRTIMRCLAVWGVVALAAPCGAAVAEEVAVPLEQLPKAVVDVVKKQFPKAELIKAEQETEDDETEYEVTIRNDDRTIDVVVRYVVTIEALEKTISAQDLPAKATAALEQKFPKASYKKIEAVYELEDGQEELEYYEVELETADKKEVEVKVKASGKIIEADEDEDEID